MAGANNPRRGGSNVQRKADNEERDYVQEAKDANAAFQQKLKENFEQHGAYRAEEAPRDRVAQTQVEQLRAEVARLKTQLDGLQGHLEALEGGTRS
jgi:ubiquinone biosynthesis protein UbiJ